MRSLNSIRPRAAQVPSVERLLVEPHRKPGTFTGRLEFSGEIMVRCTRQPLVDGARAMLVCGSDPSTPLTMRMHDRPHNSFRPSPISSLAEVTCTEGEQTPLQRQRWKPREVHISACSGDQKSTSEPESVLQARPWPKSLCGAPAAVERERVGS